MVSVTSECCKNRENRGICSVCGGMCCVHTIGGMTLCCVIGVPLLAIGVCGVTRGYVFHIILLTGESTSPAAFVILRTQDV